MSVTIFTDDPKGLLAAFDKRIAQTAQKDKITTWERLSDGVHYTHKAKEWRNHAYFKASVQPKKLVFNIRNPTGASIGTTDYGYYHGHLIETFLNHFDKEFTEACASALAVAADSVR